MTISLVFGLTIILFFIRLLSFVFSFPNNFDNLWRPGAFVSLPSIVLWLLVIVSIVTLAVFVRKLKQTDCKTGHIFFIYLAVSFVSVSLFNRTIENTNITYLMLLIASENPLSAILPNLTLDCLYESPYVLWMLGLMVLIHLVCWKSNHTEYSIPFWIIPFSLLGFHSNDFTIITMLSYCIISILGMSFSRYRCPIYILLLQFFINLFAVVYVYMTIKLHPTYITAAILTLLIFYIPSFIVFWLLNKGKNSNSMALTWILPGTTAYFLFLPLFRLRTVDNLIYLISFLNLFVFLGNVFIIVAIICLISYVSDRIIRKSGKYVFVFCSIIEIIFYILDAVLFYYSHFRINYQTLAWTMTMNDIIKTTLATCINYLSPISIILILAVLLASILVLFKSRRIFSNINIKVLFIYLLLTSQFSVTLLQLSSTIPQILRDPFYELIGSLPVSKYFSKGLTKEEIFKGFEECSIDLNKYSEKSVNSYDKKENLIFITLESVHWRYLNLFGKDSKTWPLMSRFKDRMEIFPFIFSPFPESTCGDYAVITSLIPYNQLFINQNQNMIHKGIVNELKKLNYNTYLFSSESLYDGGLINLTKVLPFDYTFSFNSSNKDNPSNIWSWGYKEEYTTGKIIELLRQRNPNQPYFLWYRTVYPHAPFELFDEKDNLVFQEKDKFGRIKLLSKYKNALLYLDRVLYDFVNKIAELDKINNQKTLIVMVGDHGEMLEEEENNNLAGHGLYTTAKLQNVACIFIKPEANGLRINGNIGSQIDIAPTVMDYLGIESSVERYEQGVSLYSKELTARPIYLSSIESYALVENGYFFEFRDKNSPNVRITRLSFSNDDLKASYENIKNWSNHKEIYEKYSRVKKFFKLQEEFLNQLK